MCMFSGRDPDGTPRLDESEARIGYRTFRVHMHRRSGEIRVLSPVQRTEWPEPVQRLSRFSFGRRAILGFYAYFDRDTVSPPRHTIGDMRWYCCIATARVALFGQVAVYEPRWGSGGYRAQACRILALSIPHNAPLGMEKAIRTQTPGWKGVRVFRKKVRSW